MTDRAEEKTERKKGTKVRKERGLGHLVRMPSPLGIVHYPAMGNMLGFREESNARLVVPSINFSRRDP